jgi:predicted NUDIX family phosphoesterase
MSEIFAHSGGRLSTLLAARVTATGSSTPKGPIAVSHLHQGRVLVVPSEAFDRLGRFQGFSNQADRYLDGLLGAGWGQFRPRAEVEDDPSFKQIIPYVIFCSGSSVFCYTRGQSQGEARLHRLRSLGVGGHVDEPDADGRPTLEAYEMALRREIDEEVDIQSPGQIHRIGLINDDATPVGQVHLGVVHLYTLERPALTPREDGLANPGFLPLGDLAGLRPEFETWSQFCIEALLRRRLDRPD